MQNDTATFDREGRQAFIAKQFEKYGERNPEILRVIRRVWGLESAGHDFLAAMYPLFCGLLQIEESLSQLPLISFASAERAWKKLRGASSGVLEDRDFEEFRHIIELEFMLQLNVSVTSEQIQKRIKLTFAMILKMIQIERMAQGQPSD